MKKRLPRPGLEVFPFDLGEGGVDRRDNLTNPHLAYRSQEAERVGLAEPVETLEPDGQIVVSSSDQILEMSRPRGDAAYEVVAVYLGKLGKAHGFRRPVINGEGHVGLCFDCRAMDLGVTLHQVGVAKRHQSAGNMNGQHHNRTVGELRKVHVAENVRSLTERRDWISYRRNPQCAHEREVRDPDGPTDGR